MNRLTPEQIKELDQEDFLNCLGNEIYEVVSRYAEAREGIDYIGNGHHSAQTIKKAVLRFVLPKLDRGQ